MHMEFHVSRKIRTKCNFDKELFSFNGNVIFADFKSVRLFAHKVNKLFDPKTEGSKMIRAGQLNAMGLIDEIFHFICSEFRKSENPKAFEQALTALEKEYGASSVDKMLLEFTKEFPPVAVFQKKLTEEAYLAGETDGVSNRVATLEEIIMLHLANENPAFRPFYFLFSDEKLAKNPLWFKSWQSLQGFFKNQPLFGPYHNDLITMLREPSVKSPTSLKGQLEYIKSHWADLLGAMMGKLSDWLRRLLAGMDMISEEEKAAWSAPQAGGGLPPMEAYSYDSLMNEYEKYSPDLDWMPRVVLLAKTVLVWLDQLTKEYGYPITRLDQIPDRELDIIASQGFTGLWLIGLWERSWGSKRIKVKCGNPEAAASAYSLHDYEIAQELGGWDALGNLRERCRARGIRLASDMVPNHTGLDSRWVVERPDLFLQTRDCPFPGYSFNGENLSLDPRISVYLEDHYYSKSDCAVVYKRVDNSTGDTRYIYHGNDGTGMPWNDTAQIDFLNPTAREEVIQKILHVARNFPIIRFDAAMVLAKKHIRRLWYPEPGMGGDIASRAEHAISRDEFNARIPNEFWREVVDRCAREAPDTLLLAEAFWMMEGYFVRTLGMHRVYNSAFMNMLKKEENQKYRDTVKNTMEFDPEVLKRFVNFMNNPDEETAVAQFGKGDKYFGVCTLMVTMPGLPMFGHGQIQGFEEKYGMEYTKAYRDEKPDWGLIHGHEHDIFPLMKKRWLFSGIENFTFYDVWNNGSVNENIFAYSNRARNERAIVFYNNKYESAAGWIKQSCAFGVKGADEAFHLETRSLAQALALSDDPNAYIIFQEQHSEKWFIRRCNDLRDNGMFVSLHGFEYQVLWNMKEVIDDETGKYGILCRNLNGAGVPDIEEALDEIFLHDLYEKLTAFVTPAFFKSIREQCTGKGARVDVLKLLSEAKPDGLAFFDMFRTFVAGNYGADTVIDTTLTGKLKKPETVWNAFTNRIIHIVQLCTEKTGTAFGGTPEAKKLAAYLLPRLHEEPEFAQALTAAAILYTLRDLLGDKATLMDVRKITGLWHLGRKMTQALEIAGVEKEKARLLMTEFVSTMPLLEKKLAAKTLKAQALDAVTAIFYDVHSYELAGVNEYDHILWFNREKAENVLYAGALQYALASGNDAVPLLLKLVQLVLKALDGAEYKVDNVTAAFKPAAKAKKAADRKPALKTGKPATRKATAAKKPATPKKTTSKKTTDAKGNKGKK